jgi:hypothetical protein
VVFRALAIDIAGEADVDEEVDLDGGGEFRSGAIILIVKDGLSRLCN